VPKTDRESSIIIHLGGAEGLRDGEAGVFVDGRRIIGVAGVKVEADAASGVRTVQLMLDPLTRVQIIGQAQVTARDK